MFCSERVVDLDFVGDVALHADMWLVMVAIFMIKEQVSQRFGINISARRSEILFIRRGERDVRMEDLQL